MSEIDTAAPPIACAPDAGSAEWFSRLYDELHRAAQRELRRNAAATISPTTLLHETYLSVLRIDASRFPDRGHFLAYAARAMRSLLVDYARNRQAQKRGGQFCITSLPSEVPDTDDDLQLDGLHGALEELAQVDARLAQCVDLKFFCGFSFAEIAELWSVSERTVQRDWDKARVLLNRFLQT